MNYIVYRQLPNNHARTATVGSGSNRSRGVRGNTCTQNPPRQASNAISTFPLSVGGYPQEDVYTPGRASTWNGNEYVLQQDRKLRILELLPAVDRCFSGSGDESTPRPTSTRDGKEYIRQWNREFAQISEALAADYTCVTQKHLRLWKNELLPWTNIHIEGIIGGKNTGIIEFLPSAEDPRPVIRIIAENPAKVNSSLLKSKLENNEATRGLFIINIFQGVVLRSVLSEAYANLPGNPYQKRPSHGASLGIANVSERQHLSETFGGYIRLEYRGHRKIYGLTCHHMLKDYSNTGDNSGVINEKIILCQPAIDHAKSFLRRNAIDCTGNPSALDPDNFGRVICSSGYSMRKYERIPKLAQSLHQVCLMNTNKAAKRRKLMSGERLGSNHRYSNG